MTDSQHLLAEYARTASETAFHQLVVRYVDLVYSTALRLVEGDTHRAQDVTQTVFADLARLAQTLSPEVMLGGWLHRHTCFAAANTMRGERRRQARERQAVEMNALQSDSKTDFSVVAPMLDEAINQLNEEDRTAILLRFFEEQDFRAVGQALGGSDAAARMRVSRALDKLHGELKRRGVTTSAATLSLALAANAVHAAPAGLALSIATATTVAGSAAASVTTATVIKTIAMTSLQKILITAALAAALGTGIYEAHRVTVLQAQVQSLRQQQAPLAGQLQQLQQERDEAMGRVTGLAAELNQIKGHATELASLRGEVTRWRDNSNQLAQLASAPVAQAADTSWRKMFELGLAQMKRDSTNAALARVAKMKPALSLNDRQEQSVRDVLFKVADAQSQVYAERLEGTISDAEARRQARQISADEQLEILALLDSGQQSAYEQMKQADALSRAKSFGNTSAAAMKGTLNLTPDQTSAVAVILASLPSGRGGQGDATEADAQNQLELRLRALAPVLTPEQLEAYRKSKLNEIEMAQAAAKLFKSSFH